MTKYTVKKVMDHRTCAGPDIRRINIHLKALNQRICTILNKRKCQFRWIRCYLKTAFGDYMINYLQQINKAAIIMMHYLSILKMDMRSMGSNRTKIKNIVPVYNVEQYRTAVWNQF